MLIAVPRELHPGERRVAVVPATAQKLVRMGAELAIESGAGAGAGHPDAEYVASGADGRSLRARKRCPAGACSRPPTSRPWPAIR